MPYLLQLNSLENVSALSIDLLPIISISANSDLIMAGTTDCFAILEQPIIPNLIFDPICLARSSTNCLIIFSIKKYEESH